MAQQVLVWRAKDKTVFIKEDVKKNMNKKMIIGGDYRKIGDEAFKNNIKVREVELDKGISEIGIGSFSGCTSLRHIGLGAVKIIRKNAFSGCTSLKNIIFPNRLESVGSGAFSMCKRLESAACCTKTISERAFLGCKGLKYVDLPEGLLKIEKEAFCDTGMKKLALPKSLEMIGDSAFLKCRELEYVKIPENVRIIEKWAFHGCNRLKVVEIPGEPEFIGEWIVNKSTKIRCRQGSAAERYCLKYGFKIEYMEEENNDLCQSFTG